MNEVNAKIIMKVHLAVKLVLRYPNEIMDQFIKRNVLKETLANEREETCQGFPSCSCYRYSNKGLLKSSARYLKPTVLDLLLQVESFNFN